MKTILHVLFLTILVCGVKSWSGRNPSVNDVKPFVDLDQGDVQVPKTHVYSYQEPVSCSGFSNVIHCFKLKLLHNVSDILDGDDYWLTDSLVIEKLSPSKLNTVEDSGNRALKMRLKKYLMSGKESNRMLLEGTMGIFRSHSLRWTPLPGVNVRMFKNPEFGGKMDMALELGEDVSEKDSSLAPRTFFRRKMQFALLSVMYKMGVITTLLGALVVISLKTLTIGVILLFLTGINTIKAIGAKLHKLGFDHGHHSSYHEYRTPEIIESGPAAVPHKEVHVHIHNSGGGPHGYISGSSQGYVSANGGYSSSASSSGPGNHPYHGWSSGGSYSPFRRSSYEPTSQSSSYEREDERAAS